MVPPGSISAQHRSVAAIPRRHTAPCWFLGSRHGRCFDRQAWIIDLARNHDPDRGRSPVPPGRARATGTSIDGEESLIEEELLVEEVSIDGMCGVY